MRSNYRGKSVMQYLVLAKTVAPKNCITHKICHTLTFSTACFLYALPRGFVIPIRKTVGLLRNVIFYIPLGINTGMLCCIVKLPDEVCVSHTKRVGENKTVLQLKQFAEVLLTGFTFLKFFLKNSDACCCHWSPHICNLLLFVSFAVNLTNRNKPGSKCNKNVSVFATQPGKT